MAIHRCGNCGNVAENVAAIPGAKENCGKCGRTVVWFETVFYFSKLVDRYLAALRELEALKRVDETPEAAAPAASEQEPEAAAPISLDGGIHNTRALATAEQHQPIAQWFAAKNVRTEFDFGQVDTSGFFDEAAKILGDNHALLGDPLEQIRYGYRRGFTWVNVDLSKLSEADAKIANRLFRELYSHTFFARYGYQKQTMKLGLTLQPALPIRRFFEGGWLEWYVFITLLEHCVAKGVPFSCARGMNIEFPNGERRELDVVFLVAGKAPLVVECKSGEFRADIEKYVKTRRALGLEKERLVICSADLAADQAAGLTAMYELGFVTLDALKPAVAALL